MLMSGPFDPHTAEMYKQIGPNIASTHISAPKRLYWKGENVSTQFGLVLKSWQLVKRVTNLLLTEQRDPQGFIDLSEQAKFL